MGCSQLPLPSTFLLQAPNNADGTQLNSVPKLQATEANRSIVFTNVTAVVMRDRGSTVVKVLCYKSEGRWFDSRWCHWNFSLT
jgi:hypothetical protein